MQSKNDFIKEIASLHGISAKPRHAILLDKAFDDSEDLFFDMTHPINTY